MCDAGTSFGQATRSKRIEIMLEASSGRATGAPRGNDAGCHGDGGGCAGFGLVLRGGAAHRAGDLDNARPITVARVIPNSPADRSSSVQFP